ALQADDPAQLVLIFGRELQDDRAAHRAAHHNRAHEIEYRPHRANLLQIVSGGQLVLAQPPAVGWIRPPVIWHVEGDDAVLRGHRRVVEQVTELPAIRSCGVQAQKWNSLSRLLDEDAVPASLEFELEVAADNRFKHVIDRRSHSLLTEGP